MPVFLILKVLAPLAVLAGAWTFGYSAGKAGVQRDWDHAKTAQMEVNLEAERMARMAETRKFTAAKGAQDALTSNLGKARADADGARAALASLLDSESASHTGSDPIAAIRTTESAVPWDVFSQCAKAVQELAISADVLEATLVGWQQWWAAVKP